MKKKRKTTAMEKWNWEEVSDFELNDDEEDVDAFEDAPEGVKDEGVKDVNEDGL